MNYQSNGYDRVLESYTYMFPHTMVLKAANFFQ